MPPVSSMPSSFQSYKPRSFKVVGAICINNNNEVLLVKGRSIQKWSFPKGHIKKQESDLDCVKRELFEETGISLNSPYLSYMKLKAASYYIFHINEMPNLNIQDNYEIDAVTWWPLLDLPTSNANVDVSMIRTLMKYYKRTDNILEYIDSNFSHRKLASIKKAIEDNALSRTPIYIPATPSHTSIQTPLNSTLPPVII